LKRTKLILLTAGFPFGSSETFLETEIKYLCEAFEKVQILAVNPLSIEMRPVPENCSVNAIYFKSGLLQKLKALTGVFDYRTRDELKIIRHNYVLYLNMRILSTLLISLQRAKYIQQRLLAFIEKENETVLYSYWCDDSALALALISEQRKELKTVCRTHGWDVYFERSELGYLPFRHYIQEQLSAIYSISEDGIDYAKKVWKVSCEKLKLSRLGIEAQELLPRRSDGILTIVSCSNLIPVKRVHLIAEAVKKLDGQFSLSWVHIGDGPERRKIEQIVTNLSDQTQVRFTGPLSNSDVFKLYRELCPNVFINVSISEGVPVSIMEAMSLGIPVIATNVGGTGEIVNNDNGLLLDTELSKTDLASSIKLLLQKDLSELSEKAILTWKHKFNAQNNYWSFVSEITQI
jgi:glycosyltransferase involved in cell wall biosynthesis